MSVAYGQSKNVISSPAPPSPPGFLPQKVQLHSPPTLDMLLGKNSALEGSPQRAHSMSLLQMTGTFSAHQLQESQGTDPLGAVPGALSCKVLQKLAMPLRELKAVLGGRGYNCIPS